MGDTTVHCPDCGVRLKVPEGKTIVRCPKCGEKVRIPEASEAEDAVQPAAKSRPRRSTADDPEDDRPPRSRRRREDDNDDDDDDRPRRRGRDDLDDDEDERPRKRRKRAREPVGDGPWLIAALAAPVCFLLMFGGAFLLNGTRGLPAGNDGPGGKLVGLGIGFLASLVLTVMGTLSVKNRQAYSKWGTEIQGGTAVGLGFIQVVIGGLMGGICLYGLIFTLVNGR